MVQDYREKYRAISDLLDANLEVWALVHRDMAKLSSPNPQGRASAYRSEQRLRALVVGKIDGEKCRLDTTGVETNLHYPTDSSLLWDGFRTQARWRGTFPREYSELELDHRFHARNRKGASPS